MFQKPQPPPPLSAEFHSTMEPSQPGAEPAQHPWKLFRSSSGKTNVEHERQSLISDPAAAQAIHLDHVNKEATVLPLGPPPGKPDLPAGGPQPPQPPNAPLSVKDLGKKMIAGHEAEGKLYTFKPPAAPQMQPPQAPQPPAAPQPAAPQSPQPPQVPQAPQPPAAPQMHAAQVMEVWTSPKLQLPMATKIGGSMGRQTTICKQVVPGEPPPSVFKIPPGYKVLKAAVPTHAPPTGI